MNIQSINFNDARNKFWQAIKDNNVNNVNVLLLQENISFIETKDQFEISSILKYIITNNDSKLLDTLIAANSDFRNNIVNNQTFHYILEKGNVLLASQMLEVKPELASDIESFPLTRSILQNNFEMTEFLLKTKPELSNTIETFQALTTIITGRYNIQMVEHLLKLAPNILDRADKNNIIDVRFVEAVNFAIESGHTQVVKFLADQKHDIVAYVASKKGLNEAIGNYQDIEMVKLLLELKPDLINLIEQSSFAKAINSDNVKLVKFLVDAKPSLIENDFEKEFVSTIQLNHVEMCKLLLELRPDLINSKTPYGDDVFGVASNQGRGTINFDTKLTGANSTDYFNIGGGKFDIVEIGSKTIKFGISNLNTLDMFNTVPNSGNVVPGNGLNVVNFTAEGLSSAPSIAFNNVSSSSGVITLNNTDLNTSAIGTSNYHLDSKMEKDSKCSLTQNLSTSSTQNKITAAEYILQRGNDMFFDLIRDNKINMVISLIRYNNKLVYKENNDGKSIFQIAIESGNNELLKALFSNNGFDLITDVVKCLAEKGYEKAAVVILQEYFDYPSTLLSKIAKLNILTFQKKLIEDGKLPSFNINYKDVNGDRLIDKAQKLFVGINQDIPNGNNEHHKDVITNLIQDLRAVGSVEPIVPITGEAIGKLILAVLDGGDNHDNAVRMLNKLYTKYPLTDEQVNDTIESFKQDVDKFVELYKQRYLEDVSVNLYWTAGHTPILGGPLVRGEPLSIVQVIDKLSGLNNVNDRLSVTWDFKKVLGHIIHVINLSNNSETLSVNLVGSLSGLKACLLGKLINLLYIVQDEVVTNDFDLSDQEANNLLMVTYESLNQLKSGDEAGSAIHKWALELKFKVSPEKWSADTTKIQGLFNCLLNKLVFDMPKIYSGYYHSLQNKLLSPMINKITSDTQLTGVIKQWQEGFNLGLNLSFIEFCKRIVELPETMKNELENVEFDSISLNLGSLEKVKIDTIEKCARIMADEHPELIEQFLDLMYKNCFFTKEVKDQKEHLLKNMMIRKLANEFDKLKDSGASEETLGEIIVKINGMVFDEKADITDLINLYAEETEGSIFPLGQDDSTL